MKMFLFTSYLFTVYGWGICGGAYTVYGWGICVWVGHMWTGERGTSGGQGTTFRSQFFASTMWFQGPNSDHQAWLQKSLYLLSHLTNHKTCVPIQLNNSNNSSSWLFYSFVLLDGIANQTLGPTRWQALCHWFTSPAPRLVLRCMISKFLLVFWILC